MTSRLAYNAHNNNYNNNNYYYYYYNVKSHENTQRNVNSIIKTAAKITEELIPPNEKRNAQQDGIQHTKARLGESLEKNGKLSNAWAVH